MNRFIPLFLLITVSNLTAQNSKKDYQRLESKVIEWRHDLHQHPELSNREFRTAEKVAKHLKSLGMEVQTGVANTGVVDLVKGKKPGKTLAPRADMDGLPVKERNDLPYRSKAIGKFMGNEVPVMHACGHDTHVAILMGAAEYLAKNNNFAGNIKFIFQPAEEGPPPGEKGGASLMIEEGVLDNPKVDAIVGLHIKSEYRVGEIVYKPRGFMAASQRFVIDIKGKQSHGSTPWQGVDPIMIGTKIIDGIQTIVSRNLELTKEGAVISVGSFHSGVRFNIIPESAQIIGTIRTLDRDMKEQIRDRMTQLVPTIAKAYGGEAVISIVDGADITFNDPELTKQLVPSLKRVLSEDKVYQIKAITGAEDFSYFQNEIPGFFFFLGGTSLATPANEIPSHHTPDFIAEDDALIIGVKAISQIAIDFLRN